MIFTFAVVNLFLFLWLLIHLQHVRIHPRVRFSLHADHVANDDAAAIVATLSYDAHNHFFAYLLSMSYCFHCRYLLASYNTCPHLPKSKLMMIQILLLLLLLPLWLSLVVVCTVVFVLLQIMWLLTLSLFSLSLMYLATETAATHMHTFLGLLQC